MVDAVGEGVLEARSLHRTVGTDAAGDVHPHAVVGEECRRWDVPALPSLHPRSVHGTSVVHHRNDHAPRKVPGNRYEGRDVPGLRTGRKDRSWRIRPAPTTTAPGRPGRGTSRA